jgi:hypothetical protein
MWEKHKAQVGQIGRPTAPPLQDVMTSGAERRDRAAGEAAGPVPRLHRPPLLAREQPPATSHVDRQPVLLGDRHHLGVAAQPPGHLRRQRGAVGQVAAAVRLLAGQHADVHVDHHLDRVLVAGQALGTGRHGVLADRDQRIRPPRGPGLVRPLGCRRLAAAGALDGRVAPRHRLQRGHHSGAVLGRQQGHQAQHAALGGPGPEAAPGHQLVGLAGRVGIHGAAALAADADELGGVGAEGELEPDGLVGRVGDAEQGADLVEGELARGEGLAEEGEVGEGVAYAEEVGGGVEVEAGPDGEPVGQRADAGAAPAARGVEGGREECHLGQGRLDVGDELAEPAATGGEGLLIGSRWGGDGHSRILRNIRSRLKGFTRSRYVDRYGLPSGRSWRRRW